MTDEESDVLVFFCNGRKIVDKSVDPEMTLLNYLRLKLQLTGTKLGCAEGGCGACTVMVSTYDVKENQVQHFSVNACLAPVCSVHGAAVTTVEGIGSTRTKVHPVQERIAKAHGSQCGFCTPGIVMSMYSLLRNKPVPDIEDIFSAFEGNLCRCTGYRPILEGYRTFTKGYCNKSINGGLCNGQPQINGGSEPQLNGEVLSNNIPYQNGDVAHDNNHADCSGLSSILFRPQDFTSYDPSQDIVFPQELMISADQPLKTVKFIGDRIRWYRPVTLKELVSLKAQYPHARIVVGNTEIGVEVKFKNQQYPVLIAATHVPEITKVEALEDGVRIGASVTLTRLDTFLKDQIQVLPDFKCRVFSAIVEMLKWFAGHQIRNVAGVGGNIVTGSPISDLNPIFMAAGSTLNLSSSKGSRTVPMNPQFYPGYRKTIMTPEEVLTSIFIPFTCENEYFFAHKQAPRREDDIAIVNSALKVSFEDKTNVINDIRIAYGGMSATTIMATTTMEALKGRKWNQDLVEVACSCLSRDLPLSPGAPGGMEKYRQSLTLSFFFKFYMQVLNELITNHVQVESTLPSSYLSALQTFPKQPFNSTQLYQEVPPGQPSFDAVGRPIAHRTGLEQATGEAKYLDDIPKRADELYAGIVFSQKAHAKIVSIDFSKAEAVEGVHCVVTHSDVPGSNASGLFGDEDLYADGKVVHVGQVIACVVAETQAIAQRAAKLVKVQYEDLEPILTIEEAIKHESYFEPLQQISTGDVDAAFNQCDHVIVGEHRLGGQEHFYLETQCCLVIPAGEHGEMEVISSSQSLSENQILISKALGIPRNRIVSRAKRLGGGFGGKETKASVFAAVVAVCANKTGHPVRCMLDRDEDMISSGTRHPFLGRYKVGFTKEGKIVALDVKLYLNVGHSRDLSQAVMERALFHCENVYKVPNLQCQGFMCKTNLPSNTAFRGFGGPQGLQVAEHWMNDIATTCGLPPEKVRELNFYKEGDSTHFSQKLTKFNLRRCWDICLSRSNYAARKENVILFNRENRWKKRGIAIVPTKFGISFTAKFLNQAGALVHIYSDGSVLVSHGGVEMGQGLHTKMVQVASRCLKLAKERIFISETSTDKVPNTSPTAASAASDLNGMAIKNACEKLMNRLEPYMAAKPKGSWDEWVQDAYMDRVSLSATGYYRTPDLGYDWTKNEGNPFNYFTYGVAASEVEIDCLTGDHHVLRTDIVMDLGDSINPAIDIGQIEGAFAQGYGLFVLEDHRWSPTGHLLTRGPGFYKIPGFSNVPAEFNVSLLDSAPNCRAVCSSKRFLVEKLMCNVIVKSNGFLSEGYKQYVIDRLVKHLESIGEFHKIGVGSDSMQAVGEPPLFLASSVFFAIKDAIASARTEVGLTGIFPLNSPASAERIRLACQDQFTEKFQDPEPGNYRPFFIRP